MTEQNYIHNTSFASPQSILSLISTTRDKKNNQNKEILPKSAKINASGKITLFTKLKGGKKSEKREDKTEKTAKILQKMDNLALPYGYRERLREELNEIQTEINENKTVWKEKVNNNLRKNGGYLSKKRALENKNIMHYRFFQTKRNKFNTMKFITFTIPSDFYKIINDSLTDNENENLADGYFIEKMGEFFDKKHRLRKDRKKYIQRIKNYMWIAEKTKVGTIHFHCIVEMIPLYIGIWLDWSRDWANLCGFENHNNSVHYGFKKQDNGHKTTHVKTIKQLANYVANYCGKSTEPSEKEKKEIEYDNKIYGRACGMSRGYSELKLKSVVTIDDIYNQSNTSLFGKAEKIHYDTSTIIEAEIKYKKETFTRADGWTYISIIKFIDAEILINKYYSHIWVEPSCN